MDASHAIETLRSVEETLRAEVAYYGHKSPEEVKAAAAVLDVIGRAAQSDKGRSKKCRSPWHSTATQQSRDKHG